MQAAGGLKNGLGYFVRDENEEFLSFAALLALIVEG
jgi:hypothetical protein